MALPFQVAYLDIQWTIWWATVLQVPMNSESLTLNVLHNFQKQTFEAMWKAVISRVEKICTGSIRTK